MLVFSCRLFGVDEYSSARLLTGRGNRTARRVDGEAAAPVFAIPATVTVAITVTVAGAVAVLPLSVVLVPLAGSRGPLRDAAERVEHSRVRHTATTRGVRPW